MGIISGSYDGDEGTRRIGPAFDLAARLENNARGILDADFGDGQKLAHDLSIALSKGAIALDHRIGDLSAVGDISKTEAFSNYRRRIMEAFPAVRDVRFGTSDGFVTTAGSWAVIYLKQPHIINRIRHAL